MSKSISTFDHGFCGGKCKPVSGWPIADLYNNQYHILTILINPG